MNLIGIEEIRLFVKDAAASAKFYAKVFDVVISYQGLIPKFKLGKQQFLLWKEENRNDFPCTPATITIITSTELAEIEEVLNEKEIKYSVSDRKGVDKIGLSIATAIQIKDLDGYCIELRNSLYPKDFGRMSC